MSEKQVNALSLAGISDAGGFVDAVPVSKEIAWHMGGKEFKCTVFVVRQPFGVVEKVLQEDGDKSRTAGLIAASIRLGEDGSEQLTYEQVYNLHPSLAWALTMVINEVNAGKS